MSSQPLIVLVQRGEVVHVLSQKHIKKISAAKSKESKKELIEFSLSGGGMMGDDVTLSLQPKTNPSKHLARLALAISRGESLAWIYDPDAADSMDVLQPLEPSHLGL